MKIFKQALKLYFCNPWMALVTLLAAAGPTAFVLYRNKWSTEMNVWRAGVLYVIEDTLPLSIFFFIFMMFLSYEYFAKTKAVGLDEVVAATRGGRFRLYGCQFGVMMIVVLLLTAGPMALNIYYYGFYLHVDHAEFMAHIIVCILLYLTGVMVVGTLLGMCASLMKTRVRAYIFIVIVALLVSPAGLMLSVIAADLTWKNVPALYYPFAITPLETKGCEDMVGFTAQSYHVARLLFWMVLPGGYLLWRLRPQGSRMAQAGVAVLLACTVGCAVVYALPASKVIGVGDFKDGSGVDAWYYYYRNYQLPEYVKEGEEPSFAVTSYEMDLKIGRQLDACVTMAVSDPALDEYPFTLYHGYKVRRVTDGAGNELPFRQEADYVTVTGKGAVDRIVMEYAGYSADYYSNAQGTHLPGWFAYYPRAGYHVMTDDQGMGLNAMPLQESVPFEVSVQTRKQVYCNLKQTGENTFAGQTDGVTLLAGFFDTLEEDGVTVVYPYLSYTPEEAAEAVRINRANGILSDEIQYLFITGDFYPYSNGFTGGAGDFTEAMQMLQFTGDQYTARTIVIYYRTNYERLIRRGNDQIGIGLTEDPFAITVGLLEQTDDPDALIAEMEKYADDAKDERTFEEFVADWQEGEGRDA